MHLGDKLSIRRGPYEWTVVVKAWQNFAAPEALL